MAYRVTSVTVARWALRSTRLQQYSRDTQLSPALRDRVYPKLGNRDIVGYGVNGSPSYQDRVDFPVPAVRFRENTADVLALREKEKGDWKKLSLEEKRALYRNSFRQTFAEMNAPTGEWKSVLSAVLLGVSATAWLAMLIKRYVMPGLPAEVLSREHQEKQLELMIKQRQGAVSGISSKWDYENNKWK